MKRFLCFLLLLAAPLSAQVVPSAYVPVAGTCALLENAAIPANSVAYLAARGSCGIPAEANAVAVVVEAIEPACNGALKLFDSGILPATAQPLMDFARHPGTTSTWAVVRLCYPALECSAVDLGLSLSAAAHVTIRAAGYFLPLE